MYRALEKGLSFKTTFGNVLTLTPPLTVTEGEMMRALDIIDAMHWREPRGSELRCRAISVSRSEEGRRRGHDRHRDRRHGRHAGPARSASASRPSIFVDGAHEETHGCDYLLANDIDMEPVPGYAAASWDKGYGDFVMKPDMATLRRLPWLDGTALVLADVLDHHHHDVPHSPRAMLKRRSRGWQQQKMRALLRLRARVLSVRRDLRGDRTPSATSSRRPPATTSRTITSSRPPRRRA